MSFLALDLGGTRLRAAVVGEDGVIERSQVRPTPHDHTGPDVIVELLREVSAGASVEAAVLGLPGRIDFRAQRLEHAPNLPQDWTPRLAAAPLSEALGLPVWLANDADLAAVGEAFFGAGRGFSDVLYLTISTGVGAGVVLDRKLVHGRRSIGEVGFVVLDREAAARGEPACLEHLASGTGLARLAEARGIVGGAPEVVRRQAAGDPVAVELFAEFCQTVALGVTGLAYLYSPEVIVIGGGLGRVGEALWEPLRAHLAKAGPPGWPGSTAERHAIQVVGAELGDEAGLCGAAGWLRALG